MEKQNQDHSLFFTWQILPFVSYFFAGIKEIMFSDVQSWNGHRDPSLK